MNKETLIKIGMIFSVTASVGAVIVDVVTNSITGWWITLYFLPLLFMPFYYGVRFFIGEVVIISAGSFLWIYTEHLYEELSGKKFLVSSNFSDRLIQVFIAYVVLAIIFRVFIKTSVLKFFTNIRNILFLKGVAKSFVHLLFAYFSISFSYSLLYATIFIEDKGSFIYSNAPAFVDFLIYSLYVPTTASFSRIVPNNSLTSFLSFTELVFGIFTTIVYLGVVVAKINSGLEENPDLFE